MLCSGCLIDSCTVAMSDQESRKEADGPPRRPSTTSLASDGPTVNSIDQPQLSESTLRRASHISPAPSLHAFYLPNSPGDRPAAKAPKVAIPRLPQRGDATVGTGSKYGGRHRVMHACEPCRSRKTKCSGEKPTCKHCQDFKVVCVYADGKRDRAKK